MDIVDTVEKVLAKVENIPVATLEDVWSYDRHARNLAQEIIGA
jgi:1-deoxy-D-xylulose-5-phosphate reductoisomerase